VDAAERKITLDANNMLLRVVGRSPGTRNRRRDIDRASGIPSRLSQRPCWLFLPPSIPVVIIVMVIVMVIVVIIVMVIVMVIAATVVMVITVVVVVAIKCHGHYDPALAAGAAARGDVVGIHRHCSTHRQGSAVHACARFEADAGEGENVPYELSVYTDGRGAADRPKHVASLTTIDDDNFRIGIHHQRADHLEDEDRIGVALEVESERLPHRQVSRGGKTMHARREGPSAQRRNISVGEIARLGCEAKVRDVGVTLGRCRSKTREYRPPGHASGRKARDRAPWADPKVAGDHGPAGIGHGLATQDREARRRTQ
jgi:hypothetical protein